MVAISVEGTKYSKNVFTLFLRLVLLAILNFECLIVPCEANSSEVSIRDSRAFGRWKDGVLRIEVRSAPGAKPNVGSGFFISPGGTVVTNYHVMKDAMKNPRAEVSFIFADGRVIKDFWVGHCQESIMVDVCVLNLNVEPKRYFRLSEREPAPGTMIYNIGNPLGRPFVIKSGIYRGEYARNNANYIAVSNHIQPGDSGGPLFSEDGQAYGMSTLIVYSWYTSALSRGVASKIVTFVGLGSKEILRARDRVARYVPRAKCFQER